MCSFRRRYKREKTFGRSWARHVVVDSVGNWRGRRRIRDETQRDMTVRATIGAIKKVHLPPPWKVERKTRVQRNQAHLHGGSPVCDGPGHKKKKKYGKTLPLARGDDWCPRRVHGVNRLLMLSLPGCPSPTDSEVNRNISPSGLSGGKPPFPWPLANPLVYAYFFSSGIAATTQRPVWISSSSLTA